MADNDGTPTFEPRRAKKGQVFTITGPDGEQRDITADDDGVVRPTSAAEAAGLDLFGLSVARSAMADDAGDTPNEPVKVIDETNTKPKGGK